MDKILLMLATPLIFSIALACLLLLSFVQAEREEPAHAGFFTVLALALLLWRGPSMPLSLWWLVPAVIAWFVLGSAYALFRWELYLRSVRQRVARVRDTLLEGRNLPLDLFGPEQEEIMKNLGQSLPYLLRTFATDLRQEFGISSLYQTLEEVMPQVTPKVRRHAQTVVLHIVYWPSSLFWYFCSDVVLDIGRWIYRSTGAVYQRRADTMFNDMIPAKPVPKVEPKPDPVSTEKQKWSE